MIANGGFASDPTGDAERSVSEEMPSISVYHGGGVEAARRRFSHAPSEWLDLSTGVNAVPYPFRAPSPQAFTRLPEAEAHRALEAAAAEAYGVGEAANVVAAPGTQALIQWLARLIPAKSVAILGFTYAEHAQVWRERGARVRICEALPELAQADVAIVVNPNNPDGRLASVESLLTLAQDMARRGGSLIVDEAFIDVLPQRCSLAPHLPRRRVTVLRSFGKTFGLAGLRLGLAVCAPEIAAPLRRALGPWAVSGPALSIGRQAYSDRDWLAATTARLEAEAARLDSVLKGAGFEIVGGTPLFRLARHEQAARWFERLGEGAILTRRFAAKPDWLRFGIPHAPRDWARLEAALASAGQVGA